VVDDDAHVVIYEQAEDGAWGALIPDLPGVVALGTSRSEVTERIQEALSAFADDLRDRARSLPVPHHAAGMVAA
jgi:predicted RNase H-like HicB family nuclease